MCLSTYSEDSKSLQKKKEMMMKEDLEYVSHLKITIIDNIQAWMIYLI